MSTGAVVGGIGAGIVAIAAIGFAIVFFLVRLSVSIQLLLPNLIVILLASFKEARQQF